MMPANKQVVLATSNRGKLQEFSVLLAPSGLQLLSQDELGVSECPEPYTTFVENALAKARHASRETGLAALADDSGLCVPALGGAPGTFSARYAAQGGQEPSDEANNRYLLQQLQGQPQRQAYFVTVLVFLRSPTDPHPIICDGVWHGEIAHQASGKHGFGYDPLFYLRHLDKTAAQLSAQEKNRLSHRGNALRKLLKVLTPETVKSV